MNRFLEAQEIDFERALQEVKNGRKISHWMWFIFPQYKGLGSSETANYYSIQSLDEANEYLNDSTLGVRLKQITKVLIESNETKIENIFYFPDNLKLKSCMTLFAFIEKNEDNLFTLVLDKYFNGELDSNTLNLIIK
ncbi:MAG: DUF1810 domain-containing protein [Bacilli bacterium]|uniref:Uncharacterized protein, DUF1810 family n=1 Tax=Algoriella xinjiangensis TaxID=684065 RepID=A0A1I4XSA4_9FLAO|nr:DUF1810 domain-containing protein [Empedobacter sp. UBA7252]SFN28725.1 Uncharacterized protein, DUF1810 family [Algoriella xinjiangensis]